MDGDKRIATPNEPERNRFIMKLDFVLFRGNPPRVVLARAEGSENQFSSFIALDVFRPHATHALKLQP